jgi:serine protease Do
MAPHRLSPLRRHTFPMAWLLLTLGLSASPPWAAAEDPKTAEVKPLHVALEKLAPESLEDLKAIQAQVQEVVQKVLPCTVGVRVGSAMGSGVIIREDGYVLTAGHVSGPPDREVTVILSDGRRIKGKTLGANRGIDSGLIKITAEGKWPFAEMGKSADLKKGQWCVATGHPGGYKPSRPPVVRLGRVLGVTDRLVQTDCTLVGGDSGGPLFDMQGRVIGIHSRIGGPIIANIHVPVDTYHTTWDRLAKAEIWGSQIGGRGPNGAYLGFQVNGESKDCRVSEVASGAPAEKAGFKVDDVITQFDGQKITNSEDLVSRIRWKRPGDEIAVEVLRGEEVVTLKLVIGRRGGRPSEPPQN